MPGRTGPPVEEAHFRLLQEFGRSTLRRTLSAREQEAMWELTCRSAGVAVIRHEDVVRAWKAFVGGESSDSGIAINGDIDPNYVTIGVTYRSRLAASHTTRTVALLRRVLLVFSRLFPTQEEYLIQVQGLALDALKPPTGKKKA